MKDYYRVIALVTVLLVAVMAAWTPGGGSAPAASPTKTGVLNVRQAIVSTSEGKQASAELQSQFSPRQNELENLNKQIEDVRSRLSAGARTLSDEEKTRLTRDGEKLARQLQRKQQELEEEVNTAQGEVFDRIGRKLLDVLDRYSRENGYSLVLDTSAQSTPVLYASSQVDVTQDIIRLYDQAYPVKGGAPASATPRQPAAPKPAPKPPSK
ncbi:MAG: hypothetical protein DMG29_15480 [Acidobacteria bacterium]|nr:MAG: hypothetical protein DMG29_15480 [Acidobacteriota bacterium]